MQRQKLLGCQRIYFDVLFKRCPDSVDQKFALLGPLILKANRPPPPMVMVVMVIVVVMVVMEVIVVIVVMVVVVNMVVMVVRTGQDNADI